eukprot:7172536-Karenia_brevis.AAC.1
MNQACCTRRSLTECIVTFFCSKRNFQLFRYTAVSTNDNVVGERNARVKVLDRCASNRCACRASVLYMA